MRRSATTSAARSRRSAASSSPRSPARSLEAVRRRLPVVLDGYATTVAALAAVRLDPAVGEVLVASHRSAEPGHDLVLAELGLEPLLDLRLRLGEASGALLALPHRRRRGRRCTREWPRLPKPASRRPTAAPGARSTAPAGDRVPDRRAGPAARRAAARRRRAVVRRRRRGGRRDRGRAGYVARPSLGPTVAAILAVAVLVVLTGALHQDGLADCADGLGARGGGAERRLAVMRDSAIGTFGALALGLWLLLVCRRSRVWGATTRSPRSWSRRRRVAGRPCCTPSPRRRRGPTASAPGSGCPPPPSRSPPSSRRPLPWPCSASTVSAPLAAAVVVAALVSAWSRRALGGRTGDTLGASVALTEAAVLVVLLGLA